ncbi:MAG TPA: aryl-sulfate sulfotransferase [Polyangiaceae bacterium]
MTAPVDLEEPNYRTLLLGMKEESDYDFQIVAQSGGQTCMSDTLSLTTGAIPNQVPRPTVEVQQADKAAPGFFVTVNYSRGGYAFIFDGDGDVVWYAPGVAMGAPEPSGVRMDFEGKALWTVTGNPTASGNGSIRRISMDGTDVQDLDSVDGHHDLAPLPGGSVAALIHSGGNCASIIEVDSDMNVSDIIPDVSTIYTPVNQCHPNAILYHPEDQSFTVSDRNPNLYVKISMTGEVEWQLGGSNALGPHIQDNWNTNHGHHLLPNGNFLFFNNNGRGGVGSAAQSPVWEFSLNLESLTATEVWSYVSSNNTAALGDVQRLNNGNTLITYSISGVVHEVDEQEQLVRTFQTQPLGYMMHRESLYGPPPK